MGNTRAHNMTSSDNQQMKCFRKKYALLQKITFNCLFWFIIFGVDHDFLKQVSFCTLCLKSLKQTIKKESIRF